MIPQKTRVAFMVRMRFPGATVRKRTCASGLSSSGGAAAGGREAGRGWAAPHPTGMIKIEPADQLDASVAAMVREAYDSGTQKNFQRVGRSARRKPQARP